jgi:hypothetical protein
MPASASTHLSGSRAARLHDPGARVEPDAALPSVRAERLAQAFERELTAGGIEAIQHLLGAGETTDLLKRGGNVPTVVDGLAHVGERDVGEASSV